MTRAADRPGFADRLVEAIRARATPACVGLDPVIERIHPSITGPAADDAQAIGDFAVGVIDAVADAVPAVKPQSACFERYGAAGVAQLERACARARERGLLVILDAKRGDIGISAEHYAAAAVRIGADAVTVNAYLGPSTVEPYLEARLGVFVLVRTSNADSNAVQSLGLTDGRTVAELMADLTMVLGEERIGHHAYSDVGAVVAATKPHDAAQLRRRMPHRLFLVPGYGAQGGSIETVRALVDAGGGGVLVAASRSVIYPPADAIDRAGSWQRAVTDAARAFADEVRPLWTQR